MTPLQRYLTLYTACALCGRGFHAAQRCPSVRALLFAEPVDDDVPPPEPGDTGPDYEGPSPF
jgi:hypothetical protein